MVDAHTTDAAAFSPPADTLVSTHPATGEEVGRFSVADTDDIAEAVARARHAAGWWASLGFTERRRRLLQWRSRLAQQLTRTADLVSAETGKPTAEAVVETTAGLISLDWAAKNARRVLAPRRVGRVLASQELTGHLEYRPFGVVGVIGPWNYPVVTPLDSIAYALAAGNAVVFKPSEYTPATGQWLADTFNEVVGEHPVLQVVHGAGPTGAALCRAEVSKISFTGSSATAKKIMATCAETLTPVVIEAGGKDAIIVDSDADLDLAAESTVWGAMTNAGQTCVGVERLYAVDAVFDPLLERIAARTARLKVGDKAADIGPMTTPGQAEVARRHIDDALARGARPVIGGAEAVRPPYVHPTILVDVPADALVMHEETFGPLLTATRVRDVDEALRLANDTPYGLGGAVFGRKRAVAVARRMRAGMVSINDVLSYAGMPSLPWGGVGASGFGRLRGDDGLREFAQAHAVAVRRRPSPLRSRTFERSQRDVQRLARAARLMFGRAPR